MVMKAIEIYMNINCRGAEAITFYEEAFNTKAEHVTTFAQGWPDCSPELEHLIMNAQFNIDGIRMQLSDNNPIFDFQIGQNMTAALIVESVEEAQELFNKLSRDAMNIKMPLQAVPWSPAYGNVTDKYGMTWQINTELS
ncbi:TPA: VOC family protein [Streptococcus agalactiae]|nr:VOC family protein [Streptococcus agalactiae]